MTKTLLQLSAAALCTLSVLTVQGAPMKVESLEGPVTPGEIASFKAWMATAEPAPNNIGNEWAQARSGSAVKALGLMYEMTQDPAILDRMIYFCDAALAERNDLAPAPIGQRKDWLGKIPPAWPNVAADPIPTGAGEQGDSIGHLGSCARLILSTPSIWKTEVPIGDSHHFGATYLDRAKTYVAQADFALREFVLPRLLDLSNSYHYNWAVDRPSGRPGHAEGGSVPWNQQMMFSYALINLAQSHEVLKDNPGLMSDYDAIVGANIKWFFATVKRYPAPKAGSPCYNWAYALPSTSGEDGNHASLDIAGFILAFHSGRYGLKESDLVPFANTLTDVMTLGPKSFSGRVDGSSGVGHGAPAAFLRSGYIQLAAFTPAARSVIFQAVAASGSMNDPLAFARFLWVKNRLPKKE